MNRFYQANSIIDAAQFAQECHEGQTRKYEGGPYIYHPMRVAGKLILTGLANAEMVEAAWLHDVIEDCGVTAKEIENRFGSYVAKMVWGLSSPSHHDEFKYNPRDVRKQIDNDFLLTQIDEVKVIKLCDIWDNINGTNHPDCPEDFLRLFCREKQVTVGLIHEVMPALSDEIMAKIEEMLK